jgi:hypothetical protein
MGWWVDRARANCVRGACTPSRGPSWGRATCSPSRHP